jgi:hypothetical protein
MSFSESIAEGGLLILETIKARGGNFIAAANRSSLRGALEPAFSFLAYKERRTGPDGVDAVAVQLVGRKPTRTLRSDLRYLSTFSFAIAFDFVVDIRWVGLYSSPGY